MEKEFVNINTSEGLVEYQIDHEAENFVVLSNVYGCVAVCADKHLIFDVVDEDEIDEMQAFDYTNDYLYVIEQPNAINVMVLEGVPYEELDLSFSDFKEL